MNRIIVKKIRGNTVAQSPAARDVCANGDDVRLRSAAGGGDLVGDGVGFFLGEAGQLQCGNKITDDGRFFAGCGQNHIANDAVLPDLFGVAGGAAVGAIDLQAERRVTVRWMG